MAERKDKNEPNFFNRMRFVRSGRHRRDEIANAVACAHHVCIIQMRVADRAIDTSMSEQLADHRQSL